MDFSLFRLPALPAGALLGCALLLATAPASLAEDAYISFGRQAAQPDVESLGGTPVTINDVVNVGTGDVVFDKLTELGLLGDLDGFHRKENGNTLFSSEPYVFGVPDIGVAHPGDVIEYDPGTDTFSVFFSNNNFVGLGNVDAVSIAPSGNLLLSTKGPGNLPGLGAFQDGDVVEWDGHSASIYLAEGDIFTSGANNSVDAIHSVDEDSIIISPRTEGKGGIGTNRLVYGFDSADLFEINLPTGIATRFLDGENLWDGGATRQTDAAFVPPEITCPCFDAAFLAEEISNVEFCGTTITPVQVVSVVNGTDDDGCRATARAFIPFDAGGNPGDGACFRFNADLSMAGSCVADFPTNLPIDFDEYLVCRELIEDRCH